MGDYVLDAYGALNYAHRHPSHGRPWQKGGAPEMMTITINVTVRIDLSCLTALTSFLA
jgi:hypothetical protein